MKKKFNFLFKIWQRLLANRKLVPTIEEYNLLLSVLFHTTFDLNMKKVLKPNRNIENKSEAQLPEKEKHDQNPVSINKDLVEKSDSSSIINLTKDQVNIIDQFEIVGKAINEKIKNLEWWEKIDNEKDLIDIMKPLARFNPEFETKLKIREIKNLLVDPKIEINPNELINDTSEERLKLVGNIEGVLNSIRYHKQKANMKTFILLLQVNIKFLIIVNQTKLLYNF
jgi:hypothetical protein